MTLTVLDSHGDPLIVLGGSAVMADRPPAGEAPESRGASERRP